MGFHSIIPRTELSAPGLVGVGGLYVIQSIK